MHSSQSTFVRRHPRVGLALALVASMLAAGVAMTSSSASAAPPAPVSIVIDAVTSDVAAPGGTPQGAVPTVLVKVGDTAHVRVSFFDATGAPAAFNKDTTLAVTSDREGMSQLTRTAVKGATSATLDVRFAAAVNQVSLSVAVPGKAGSTIAPGVSSPGQRFDVVSALRFVAAAPNTSLQQGIGGDSECLNATEANPVCGIVILPHGAQSSQVLLSLGACDSSYAGCGSTRGSVVQALTGLTGLYTKTDPATLLIKCDKSLCTGGAISDQHLSFSLNGNDALGTAEPCPAKGTVGASQPACVDYVQSKRDGSGDTLLYLLFTQDMRGSVG
jgi:hypothetical protein